MRRLTQAVSRRVPQLHWAGAETNTPPVYYSHNRKLPLGHP